jgi:beta-lactamase class A
MLQELIMQAIDFQKLNCAFVVENLKTGEHAFFNQTQKVPSASLIKLPVMAEVIRQVKLGGLDLHQRITVKAEDKVDFSILTMLETGNTYSLQDILTLMIVQSDNTAANILIDLAGMDHINQTCNAMGLSATILQRKMMDQKAREAGRENYTSASDMARFLKLLYQGEVADKALSMLMMEIMKQQLDSSMLRLYIPDETVIAHKTGDLEGIAHDAAVIFHKKSDYILTVLTWNAVSNNEARQTIGQISKVVYDYFVK